MGSDEPESGAWRALRGTFVTPARSKARRPVANALAEVVVLRQIPQRGGKENGREYAKHCRDTHAS